MRNPTTYYISYGGVSAFVARTGDTNTPSFMHFFGRAEYDSRKCPLTDSMKAAAQPIVDKLNSGVMTEKEATVELDKLYWS